MKIVKFERSEVVEYLYTKRCDIQNMRERLKYILDPKRISVHNYPDWNTYNSEFQSDLDVIRDALFERTKRTQPSTTEMTIIGLDEAKIEIRNELQNNIDMDIKSKLDDAKRALVRNEELHKENKTLSIDNKILTKKNKELEEQHAIFTKLFSSIKAILKDGYTFWNKSVILDNISRTIKKYKHENN